MTSNIINYTITYNGKTHCLIIIVCGAVKYNITVVRVRYIIMYRVISLKCSINAS